MSPEEHLSVRWDSREPLKDIAAEAYLVVQHLSLRRPWNTILWRFYAIFFYMLGSMPANGARNISDLMHQRLVEALQLSQKITDDIDVMKQNLRSWTAAGFKYHKICLRLGQGALFLLPQVQDTVWEDEHSATGSNKEDSIDSESHKKRRRDDSFPSYDSSLSQQASGFAGKNLSPSLPLAEMTHEKGGVSANHILDDVDFDGYLKRQTPSSLGTLR
ncbi:hypothetical protein EAF04_007702 [Stromatinia cepivora]|nr:hypothetical protein EAF04_007702 [Stromatinia cepivora]